MYANGKPEGSKVSRLAQWKQVEKTTGVMPEALQDRPEFPAQLDYLWTIFTNLAGSNGLTYVEVDAYIRLMKVPLSPWEIDVLFQLEAVRNG